MKTMGKTIALVLVGWATEGWTQGQLVPPGAPEPMMKTLEEIYTRAEAAETAAQDAGRAAEPRIPITNLPYTVTTPGGYYLTCNLSGSAAGITINSDNVTLDLSGFTLSGDATGDAISADTRRNIEIRNGTLQNWHYGLNLGTATQVRLVNLNVLSSSNHGILLGDDSQVKNCRMCNNAFMGIFTGRRCNITDCVITENGTGGIEAGYEARVTGCRVERNQGGGIGVRDDSLVQNCIAMNNGLGGNGANIGALGSSRIIGNQVKYGPVGLILTGSGSVVADNHVKGCEDNYSFVPNNQLNLVLSEVPEFLDWPCVVKLAGTLSCTRTNTNGITVNADNVTIDLDGHALIGPGENSGDGIRQGDSFCNLTVLNGTVSNWRGTDSNGVGAFGRNNKIEHLQATTNQCGIYVRYSSSVSDCMVIGNRKGIVGTRGCNIANNSCFENRMEGGGGSAIIVNRDCRVESNFIRDNDYWVTANTLGGNLIIRNSGKGNTQGCLVLAGNYMGPISFDPATETSPWANFFF